MRYLIRVVVTAAVVGTAAASAQPAPAAALADDAQWSSHSNEGYRSSASFLAFLLERYGAERLKQIYHAGSDDIAARMQAVYGKTLEALEAEWLAAI